jgi:formylmethanofuran dehydrogenase subunit E
LKVAKVKKIKSLKENQGESMNAELKYPEQVQETIAFHGHWCPGLAIGVRAALWALEEMGKSPDEEIVAVVETDMCGVDAIQHLLSCTFGKGNLIHKDYGKNAFSFYRRRDGKSARLVARPDLYGEVGPAFRSLVQKMQHEGLTAEEEKTMGDFRERIKRHIMEADFDDLFEIKIPKEPIPQKARILSSLTCAACGESVMGSRVRHFKDQVLCIPCSETAERR